MIVSINQPAYLPWLGYFHRIAMSDLHVVLDHVQLEKGSFTNRNKVRTRDTWCWLTVPVSTAGRFGALPINEVRIAETDRWRRKHLDTIAQSYGRCAGYESHRGLIETPLNQPWEFLDPLMSEINTNLLHAFDIDTPLVKSAELKPTGIKSELVLDLCRETGATCYLSGPLGRDYLDLKSFERAGIEVRFHDFEHPRYAQAFSGFEPFMTALDLLFNHPDTAREVRLGEDASGPARAAR